MQLLRRIGSCLGLAIFAAIVVGYGWLFLATVLDASIRWVFGL
jgi:hypothetical protein